MKIVIRISEEQARAMLKVVGMQDNNDCNLEKLKKHGFVEKSALDKAREEKEKIAQHDDSVIGVSWAIKIANMYERAIKEIQEMGDERNELSCDR